MNDFGGKVAIVSGAGSGIGQATAKLFADRGAKVVVCDVNEAGGEDTVEQIKRAEGEAFFVKADVSQNAQVQEVVGQAMSRYGGVHVLHNNAAILRTHHGGLDEASEQDWRQVIDINLTGVFLMAKAVAPVMRAQGGGAIVNMASSAALHTLPYGLAYTAAKAGVLHLTRSLAEALAPDKIRVNAICPYGVDTPMVSDSLRERRTENTQSWLLQPSDVADLVAFLASHESMTGQGIVVEMQQDGRRFFTVKPPEAEPFDELT